MIVASAEAGLHQQQRQKRQHQSELSCVTIALKAELVQKAEAALPLEPFEPAAPVAAAEPLEPEVDPVAAAAELAAGTAVDSDANRSSDSVKVTQFDNKRYGRCRAWSCWGRETQGVGCRS